MSLAMPQSSPSLPPHPEFSPFNVPHLCASVPYDQGDLATYPERHGWVVHHQDEQCHVSCHPGICYDGVEPDFQSRSDHYQANGPVSPMLSRLDNSAVTPESKVAFLQSWLFFGTLYEVSRLCGYPIDIETEFLVDDGRRVSTSALNGLAGRWFMALSDDKVGDKAFMERILTIARRMALLLSEEVVSRPECDSVFRCTPAEARVLFSIDILLRVLALHLLLHINSPGFACSEEEGWGAKRISSAVDWVGRTREGEWELVYLDPEMGARGWCRSEARMLQTDGMHRFAAILRRPLARDHSGCGDAVCGAYQVDEAFYKLVHTDLCSLATCSPQHIGVRAEDLVEILKEDKVPVVVIADDLGVTVASSDAYPYIALSHVWADGLGNPRQNALPMCQLRRLREYIVQLSQAHGDRLAQGGTVAFWMDTLCIPVGHGFGQYRNKAIRLMSRTFREATAVLVLDKELGDIQASTASFLELGIRILCSGWMKRLWTLEEASFALSPAEGDPGPTQGSWMGKRLYFQLRDGPFHPWTYAANHRSRQEVNEVLMDEYVVLELRLRIPVLKQNESFSGNDLFVALNRRSTSKDEDIPICAASILGLDASSVLSASDRQGRLSAFYRLLRSVPEGLLWIHDPAVEKLAIAPFRWAPTSITTIPDDFLHMSAKDLACDERGLHVRYAGFILDSEVLEYGTSILGASGSDEAPAYGSMTWSRSDTPSPSLDAPMEHGVSNVRLAILIKSSYLEEFDPELPNAAIIRIEREEVALVTDVAGNADTELLGTVHGYGHFVDSELPEFADGLGVQETRVVRCTRTNGDQRWCIT